ncbi:autotransporter outer membrane beta-barrel domain-containing protein, partial [Yersinia enterocolitica]
MSHHNTLNTRLLPLSILISSLVSGGAAAGVVPTPSNIKDLSLQTNLTLAPTGPFTRIAEGGSFLITNDTIGDTVQENTLQEKSIFEKLSDYLADGFITQEQKEKWQENLERLDEKNTALASAQEAANLATKASEEASQDATKMKEREEAKGKEIIAKEDEIEDLKNTLSTNNREKKTTVEALALNPDDADIAKKVTDLLASSKEELEAKNNALVDKIMAFGTATEAKKQHDAKIKELDDKLGELDTKLTNAKGNETAILNKALTDAEGDKTTAESDADSDIAKAKVKHETTKNDLGDPDNAKRDTAEQNQKEYNDLAKVFDDKIAAAKQAVTDKAAEIQQLERKELEIRGQKGTAQNEKTQIDDNLTDKTDAKDAAKNEADAAKNALTKAEAADKAIKEAEAAQIKLTTAQAEQQNLTNQLDLIKADLSMAETAKQTAARDLTTKTSELDLAQKAVKDLVDNTPATELPTANKTIAQGNSDTVAADTVAIGTKVAGGTQDVEKDGKIIGSIISEDGTVNLAVGAEARNTVVDQGTINNIGGTDHNSVINDGGKLILAGTTTQVPNGDDVINIAKSHNAQINTGGTAEVGANSEIHNLSSTGGAVALKDGAKAFDTIINGGTFTIEKGADAQHTSLTNAHLELIEGATADDTKLANHSTFTLLDGATTTGTLINSDSQFIVNDNATADITTLNSGEFIVDGTANNTTVAGGKFAVNKGATADTTTLNSGEFIVDGTANN